MIKIYSSKIKNYRDYFEYFKKLKKNFQEIRTEASIIFQNPDIKIIISNSYSTTAFYKYLAILKKEIKERYEKKFFSLYNINREDLNYFGYIFSNISFMGEKKVYEIDLSKAYLTTIRNLNIISDKLYKKIYSFSGHTRKKIIGSLATKKFIIEYNEKGEEIERKIKQDEFFTKIWYNICFELDTIMENLLFEMNGIFYWVDNLFFDYDEKYFKKIKEIEYLKNFEYKINENILFKSNCSNHMYLKTLDNREFRIPYKGLSLK